MERSGNFVLLAVDLMKPISGTYECKLDAKGRFLVPSALLRQLPEEHRIDFMLNRSVDPCLDLYPMTVWQDVLDKIYRKNQFDAANRTFARLFQSGATPVSADGNNRLLIPKRLIETAGLESDIILVGAYNKIEIWDLAKYEQWVSQQMPNFEQLSQTVMGQSGNL